MTSIKGFKLERVLCMVSSSTYFSYLRAINSTTNNNIKTQCHLKYSNLAKQTIWKWNGQELRCKLRKDICSDRFRILFHVYLWPLAFITLFCTGAGRACFQLSAFVSPLLFFPEFYQHDGCWPLLLSCHDLPTMGDVPVKALAANMEALRCLKTLHFHLVMQLLNHRYPENRSL